MNEQQIEHISYAMAVLIFGIIEPEFKVPSFEETMKMRKNSQMKPSKNKRTVTFGKDIWFAKQDGHT